MKLKSKDLATALLFLALPFAWFFHVIFYDNIFCHADLSRYFFPLRHFGASMIKSGHVPLWNPYILCGTPFLAILQSVVFYPISIIYYILPSFKQAFNAFIIIHIFLASIFMYRLMRYWRCQRVAAIVSGLTYAYGGYLISLIVMNTSLSTVTWVPLIVLFYDRFLNRGSLRDAVYLVILMAVQFLGGNPDFVYMTQCVLLLQLLFTCLGKKSAAQTGLHVCFLMLLNVAWMGLAAFQVIPFVELLQHSARSAGSTLESISRWSLTPLELLSFVLPYIKGNVSVPQGHLDPQKWVISYYIGIIPFLFSLMAFLKRDRRFWLTLVLLFISTLLSLGKHSPLFTLFYEFVPGFTYIRYPVKYLFPGYFALCILSGFGANAFFASNDRQRLFIARRILILCALLGISLVVFVAKWAEIRDFFVLAFMPSGGTIDERLQKVLYTFLSNSLYAIHIFIFLVLFTVLLIVYLRKLLGGSTFSILLITLISVDLWAVNNGIVRIAGSKILTSPPPAAIALMPDKSYYRICQGRLLWDINKKIYGFSYSEGIRDRLNTFMANAAMYFQIEDIYGYDSLVRRNIVQFVKSVRLADLEKRKKLFGGLNVKYLVGINSFKGRVVFQDKLAGGRIAYNDGNIYDNFQIEENEYFKERARLVKAAVFFEDPETVLRYMLSNNFDHDNQIVIQKKGKIHLNQQNLESPGKATIIHYAPDEVIIDIQPKGNAWLFLADSYYPGWRVYVDGEESSVYRANYLSRAVPVEEGDRRVVFKYKPLSFKIGCLVSAITLALLIVCWIASGKKKSPN